MGLSSALLRRTALSISAVVLLCLLMWLWVALQQRESTLEIRPTQANVSIPDGFSVWHHLDANGIRFKSITPKNDVLLIKFDSSDQRAAAKEVLDRSLPHGYIIALEEEDSLTPDWLSRLRDSSHRFG